MATIIELANVKYRPALQMGDNLPAPMRIGDTFRLEFQLERMRDGRTFRLVFSGMLRVTHVSFSTGPTGGRQHLTVETVDDPPTWRAIKNEPRKLPPTKFPPTEV